MISFWGGGDPEHWKLGSFIDHEERLETCLALIGCSPSAQMTPRERQGTRNRKIPQHIRRLFVYQLEHRISAPSCNGDCKGASSQYDICPGYSGFYSFWWEVWCNLIGLPLYFTLPFSYNLLISFLFLCAFGILILLLGGISFLV